MDNRSTKRNKKIPIEISVSSLLGSEGEVLGRIGTFRDITQRKMTQKQLLKLEKAATQSSSIIVITDAKGEIEYVNPAFTEITGYSIEEVQGKTPRILKSNHQTEKFYKDLWQTLTSKQTWKGEFLNKKKDRTVYWENAVISPIVDEKNNIISYIAVKEDITEVKKARETLVAAKEKAEESDRLKTAFLQNMSHEIRTPLNGILGFAELLKEADLNKEDVFNYSNIITKSGHRLLDLINNILDISKIESGNVDVNPKPFTLNYLLKDLWNLIKLKAEEKGLALEMDYGLSDSDSLIISDKGKLNQIIINLINNAIKFTSKGKIVCNYVVKDNFLHFSVKDTGVGIEKKHQDKIFNRFYQTDFSKSREFEGAGLGLAITKGLVELLGGEIGFTSKKGEGSNFFFTIPYKVAEKKKNSALTKDILIQKRLKVLVAEDDDASYLYIEALLDKFDIELHHTLNGKTTIEFCKNNDLDLVLMDINMPELDGLEATKIIKTIKPQLPIIVQSAYAFSSEQNEAFEAGCDGFVSKPVIKGELLNLITKLV